MTPAQSAAVAIVREACAPCVGVECASEVARATVGCADRIDLHIAADACIRHRRAHPETYGWAWDAVTDLAASEMVARVRGAM